MRHSRKRTLLKVLLLLAGGAIINVAVAWGCAKFATNQRSLEMVSQGVNGLRVDRALGRERVTLWKSSNANFGFGWRPVNDLGSRIPDWSKAYVENFCASTGSPPIPNPVAHAAGWPFLALSGAFDLTLGMPTIAKVTNPRNAVVLTAPQSPVGRIALDSPLIPLAPIWPGFAINTILYAAILWPLFAAPGFVRRRLRARRGQCPACAYPVGASEVCTECGRPLR